MSDSESSVKISRFRAVSIWSSIELDCMSRGLCYADYVHYHGESKTPGGVVTEAQYASLNEVLFSEELMADMRHSSEELLELAALAVILT